SPDGSFCKWLITIARNICVDELRRRRRRMTLDEVQRPHVCCLTPEQAVMLAEVRDQLEVLPREYRTAYCLFVDGYSYKEIMNRTGFSYLQVKTYIQTTKRHLWRRFHESALNLERLNARRANPAIRPEVRKHPSSMAMPTVSV